MSKPIEELLPEEDIRFLKEKYSEAKVYEIGNEVHVLLPSFPFPAGYTPRSADLLLRLQPGYPDAKPDMFWTKPDVRLVSGAWPTASEHHEIPGAGPGSELYTTAWQRWSRHTSDMPWRAGIDGLRHFVAAIKNELARQI